MKNKLIIVVGALILAVLLVWILANSNLPFLNGPKDKAWDLFEEYMEYNKEGDLEGVKSVVYKLSEICTDPAKEEDCKTRMASAYQYHSLMKKSDFKNVWEDEKQIILSTDFWDEETESDVGRFRSIIFFLKDENGNLKLLNFSPVKGSVVAKGDANIDELKARVLKYTEDKDMDLKSDYEEECLHKPDDASCVKTDPKVRDTDQDGIWDGVQILLD